MSRNARSARGFPIGPVVSRSTMRPGATGGAASANILSQISTPSQQDFPSVATGTGTWAGRTWSNIFACQDNGTQTDLIGSKTLAAQNGALSQRCAPGFYDGSDMISRFALETTGVNSQCFESPNNTDFDFSADESFAWVVVARQEPPSSGNRRLLAKYTAGSVEGYLLQCSNVGRYNCIIDDGTNRDVQSGTVDTGYGWAPIIFGRDCDAGVIYLVSLRQEFTPALTATGAIDPDYPFALGMTSSVGNPAGYTQWAWLGLLRGANAEGLTQEMLIDWWAHLDAPHDTYTRSGQAHSWCGYEAGFGLRAAPWHTDEFTWGYRAEANGASGGITERYDIAKSNAIHDEMSHANWVKSNITASEHAAEAPNGMKSATRLTAGAANATAYMVATTTAAQWTYSVSAKLVSGVGEYLLRLRRNDTGVEVAVSGTLTAGATWEVPEEIAATLPTTTTRCEIEILNSGDVIDVWCNQMEVGYRSSPMPRPTQAMTASRADRGTRTVSTTNLAQSKLDSLQGDAELKVILDQSAPDADMMLYQAVGAIDNDDRHDVKINSSGDLSSTIYSSTSVSQGELTSAPVDWTTERTVRVRWDSAASVQGQSEHHDHAVDGTRTSGGDSDGWTPSAEADTLYLGEASDGSAKLVGDIYARTIYDEDREL